MSLGPLSSEGISMAPGDPIDRLPDSERALLRLLAWLAACEGEAVPPEELELLERLVALSLLYGLLLAVAS